MYWLIKKKCFLYEQGKRLRKSFESLNLQVRVVDLNLVNEFVKFRHSVLIIVISALNYKYIHMQFC